MPMEPCSTTVNGSLRQGYRWGEGGKCYPCAPGGDCGNAKAEASKQGRAIEASKHRHAPNGIDEDLWDRTHGG